MKTRLILLSLGLGFFLCAVLGSLLDSSANGAFLWLLIPAFLMVGVGGDRKLLREASGPIPDAVWFAPNS